MERRRRREREEKSNSRCFSNKCSKGGEGERKRRASHSCVCACVLPYVERKRRRTRAPLLLLLLLLLLALYSFFRCLSPSPSAFTQHTGIPNRREQRLSIRSIVLGVSVRSQTAMPCLLAAATSFFHAHIPTRFVRRSGAYAEEIEGRVCDLSWEQERRRRQSNTSSSSFSSLFRPTPLPARGDDTRLDKAPAISHPPLLSPLSFSLSLHRTHSQSAMMGGGLSFGFHISPLLLLPFCVAYVLVEDEESKKCWLGVFFFAEEALSTAELRCVECTM